MRRQTETVWNELKERNLRLRGGRPLPDLEGKQIILADDGLESGFTIKADIYEVRKCDDEKIIVAVPTAPLHTVRELITGVDALYCPNICDSRRFAVADAYATWRDPSEPEVFSLLEKPEA